MLDTKAIAAALAPTVKAFVSEAVNAATAPLLKRIEELEAREPIRGLDGAPGRDGVDGRDGKDAEPVTPEQVAEAVARYMAENPVKDGADGRDGRDGVDGQPGEKGADGADGIGLAGAIIDRDGNLVVTLTNGEAKALGPVVGRDGKDGERGPKGFDLDAFDVVLKDDGRTVELAFEDGEKRFIRELALPTMIYRGIYQEGREYERGDTVTFGGSLWHCNGGGQPGEWAGTTTEKPGDGAKAWTLAAKRGRDGKDFAGPQPRKDGPVKI